MGRMSARNWALLIVIVAALVLIAWQIFGRPLGQTLVSATAGLIFGLLVVRLRGRRRPRR